LSNVQRPTKHIISHIGDDKKLTLHSIAAEMDRAEPLFVVVSILTTQRYWWSSAENTDI